MDHRKSRQSLYLAFSALGALGFFIGTIYHVSTEKMVTKPTSSLKSNWEVKVETPVIPKEESIPSISKAISDFRGLGQEVMLRLTKKSDLESADSDEDSGHHPSRKHLVDSAYELGRIEDALQAHPSLVREGIKFYRGCALNSELLSALRAVCVSNLREHARDAGISDGLSVNELPEEIERIAKDL